MTMLPDTLAYCLDHDEGTVFDLAFKNGLKPILAAELAALPATDLSLQHALQAGLRYSSSVSESPLEMGILAVTETGQQFSIKLMVFYSGVIAGCSCADDPTPVDEIRESCEVRVVIERRDGRADIEWIVDACHT